MIRDAREDDLVAIVEISRFPKLSLVDDSPEYRPNPVLRGLRRLELSLS